MADQDDTFGFAPPHDVAVAYMARTRAYYGAFGYAAYRWAQYADVPFAPLERSLADARVALVTTAAPNQPEKGDQGPGAVYNAKAKFYEVYTGATDQQPDLRISHLGYDRGHTTAEDPNSYFPLPALRRAAEAGRIGEVSPRFYGLPTNRSYRATLEQDCPALLARIQEDRCDVAILVAT